MCHTNQEPWYRQLHRLGQTNLTEDDPRKCDLEFWKKYWKAARIQGVIINCGGIVAYYPSKYSLQYQAVQLDGKDFFGKFNEAAREAGLYVIARMDINCAGKEFYKQHPGWFAQDKYGKPIMTQGRYVSCVNSGYYKEYIPAVLEEIIEKYHPDGFADNSWKGLGRNTICYCKNCRDKFKKDCGLNLPEKVSWEDPAYRAWIRWSYKCRNENWDLFNIVTRKAGGGDCLWFGMINADPFSSAGSFTDIKALCKRCSIIFSDHQTRDFLNGFEQNAANGNLLRLASDENITVLESMSHYFKGNRTFRLSSSPEREVSAWMQEGIAGGISPWYHHVGGSTNDRRQFLTSIPTLTWHEKNVKYLYNRKNMANVGVVWSQTNIDFYGRDDYKEKTAYPWAGFLKALSRAGIPFLPIHAGDIGKYQDRIETLILPEVAILTQAQEKDICDFLYKGKNIILTGRTGTLNEDMEEKKGPLYELLGLRHTGKVIGAFGKQDSNWLNQETHNYIRIPKNRHGIFAAFENTDILPFGGGVQLVESNGTLKPVCSYIPSFPIYPPEFSWIREEREEIAPVYAGTLSTGSRVVYFAGDLDRCYGKEQIPDHGDLLAESVKWTLGDSLPVTVQGKGHINVNFYKKNEDFIIQLVNLTGSNCPAGTYEESIPIGPIIVTFRSDYTGALKAKLTVADKTVTVIGNEDRKSFMIETLEEHEMIVVKRA